MALGAKLQRAFFERDCVEVARDLVGCVVVRTTASGERLAGRIVEVEAYLGDATDPASHSHSGPTRRNATMFGPPGRLYTYRSYGIHTCANLVCEPQGIGAAVLLRALEPLRGRDTMCQLRGLEPAAHDRLIASGPGRLAQALGLSLEDDGLSALGGALRIHAPADHDVAPRIVSGPRVGITRAAALPYRFHAEGSPLVSPYRAGKARKRRA